MVNGQSSMGNPELIECWQALPRCRTWPAVNSQQSTLRVDRVCRRAVKNMALSYLAKLKTPEVVAELVARFDAADNMTDQVRSRLCNTGVVSDTPSRPGVTFV